MKLQIGILFGGPSRDRERSFLSGRTIYDQLDRALFEPVPIFIDNHLNFILLEWPFLYKDSILDFYPPFEELPPSPHGFRVYLDSLGELPAADQERIIRRVGRKLLPEELPGLINIALLAIPGPFGNDGRLQDLLSGLNIPFTGPNAGLCRQLANPNQWRRQLVAAGHHIPEFLVIERELWSGISPETLLIEAGKRPGFPLRVRPSHHPVSTGSIVNEEADPGAFEESINSAFFREIIPVHQWVESSHYDKIDHLRLLADLDDGLGFPVEVTTPKGRVTAYHPEQLFLFLNQQALELDPESRIILESRHQESSVLLEEHIEGTPFSCLVINGPDDTPFPFAPVSEIPVAGSGLSGTEGPAAQSGLSGMPAARLDAIRQECARVFSQLNCRPFARFDGLITPEGRIYMTAVRPALTLSPTAFIFRQTATLGLTPSQTLNLLLHVSLQERRKEFSETATLDVLIAHLDEQMAIQKAGEFPKKKIAVLFGGRSFERQLSLESGRNIYEKLLGTAEYQPIPVFMHHPTGTGPSLFQIPVELILEKDIDHIHHRLNDWQSSETEEDVRAEGKALTLRYASSGILFRPEPLTFSDLAEIADSVFIALQGVPAENGDLQLKLEAEKIPFNGSDSLSTQLIFQKYRALQVLKKNGLAVPRQILLSRETFEREQSQALDQIESALNYPFFARSSTEYCPAAYRKINKRSELEAYIQLIFRPEGQEELGSRYQLKLRPREAFPRRDEILFEGMITANGAQRFFPIVVGVTATADEEGRLNYEVFPPSEQLSADDPLTLEEQYRSAENRYLTPARFAGNDEQYKRVFAQVSAVLEKGARILNTRGCVQLTALVRIFDQQRVETIITDIQALPPLTPGNPVFQQAALKGLPPAAFLSGLLDLPAGPKAAATPSFSAIGKKEEAMTIQQKENAEETEENAAVADSFNSGYQEPVRPFSDHTKEKMTFSDYLKKALDYCKLAAKRTWEFISSPFFLKNLGIMSGFLIIVLILVNLILRVYTNHGESLEVHDYVGLNVKEAQKKAQSRSFQIVISDSIFLVDRDPNIVLEQYPAPFSRVKENRRIYLTITSSTAPQVLLPTLDGAYNYETYRRKLIRLGLKTSIMERQFDNKLEENTILYLFHEGRKITESDLRRGIKIPKGDALQFVVTERLTNQVEVPDLVCKRFEAASFLLSASNLIVGEVFGDTAERDSSFVYLQEPNPGTMIRMGEPVNIYLSSRRPRSCDE